MRASNRSIWIALCAYAVTVCGPARAGEDAARSGVALGREIFHREWIPGDDRARGGDGLGPAYNDTSCVACHNQGAPGGGGPNSKNVDILSAFRTNGNAVRGEALTPAGAISAELAPLLALHPGFRTGRSVVVPKFGVDPNYAAWRDGLFAVNTELAQGLQLNNAPPTPRAFLVEGGVSVQVTGAIPSDDFAPTPGPQSRPPFDLEAESFNPRGSIPHTSLPVVGSSAQVGAFTVVRTQRNPSPLFGTGLIDAVPDAVLEKLAEAQKAAHPESAGRVSRTKDGRAGKFGWKGQTASLSDFVRTACAVEVGLEVPGVSQAVVPNAPFYKADGPDLSASECDALTGYLAALPAPAMRTAAGAESASIDAGRASFEKVGCAVCHAADAGPAKGLFSDLLIHDMGNELADSGQYSPEDPSSGDDEPLLPRQIPVIAAVAAAPGFTQAVIAAAPGFTQAANPAPARLPRGATRQEWRTPPLWGVRDSGPYLHDGRAETIEQAIALHGGQGQASVQAYNALSPRQKLQLQAFLKSLVAPTGAQLARAE